MIGMENHIQKGAPPKDRYLKSNRILSAALQSNIAVFSHSNSYKIILENRYAMQQSKIVRQSLSTQIKYL